MRYIFLIYGNEGRWETMGEAEQQAAMEQYLAFSRDARAKGIYVGGDELHPVAMVTSVRLREGKRLVTDGPFADTKEQLGGSYMLDCQDLDEAIEWASRVPAVNGGTSEIRPIVDHSTP